MKKTTLNYKKNCLTSVLSNETIENLTTVELEKVKGGTDPPSTLPL